AALFAHRSPDALPALAAVGPIPRRVAALLDPVPPTRLWPPSSAHVAFAGLVATAGTTMSALSSLNATVTLVRILHAATPL
ncbi:M56 family peptidase, partial [Streptomyces sp. NPDC002922]